MWLITSLHVFSGLSQLGKRKFDASSCSAARMLPDPGVALRAAKGAGGVMPVCSLLYDPSCDGLHGTVREGFPGEGLRLQALGITGTYARRQGGSGRGPGSGTACAKAQRQERARCTQKSPTSDRSVKNLKSVCQSVSLSLSEAVKMLARSRQGSLDLGGFGGCRRWVAEDGQERGAGKDHIKATAVRWGRVSWWTKW